MVFLSGEASSRIMIKSKIAPKRAPGGTAFHQGRIATAEKEQPRIASHGQLGWCLRMPAPEASRQSVETSHNGLKALPAQEE